MWWEAVLATLAGCALAWLGIVVVLYVTSRRQGDPVTLRSVLLLLPDVLRLTRRLAGDPALPRGVRLWLLVLVLYLSSPVDLVPDFIPVVGYLDDALVTALALRSVVRRAGVDALERHWSGTPEGLRLLKRLSGTP